jgi:hypothetical protein
MTRLPQTPGSRVASTATFTFLLLLGLASGAGLAAGAADSPTVTPATGGGGVPIVFGGVQDVEAIGYDTAEFFISGSAHLYTTAEPLTSDGKWNAISADPTTAAYTTRVIVYTPKKWRRFNGTVYVEWLNVSGLVDASPDWAQSHIEVARQHAAFVLVSAQAAGVNQLKFGGIAPGDPVRYAPLNHPGDDYSYDIFSQAGQAVRDGGLLRGRVRRVIAMGQSQSAGRLATYIDAVHRLVEVYDGYIVHSRGAGSSRLSAGMPTPVPTLLRDDLLPVIAFQTESDVANSGLLVRQPETPGGNYRLWEVAGTAHFDHYGLNIGPVDLGDGQGEIDNLAAMQDPLTMPNPPGVPIPGLFVCKEGINTGPMHWVINAAVHWINRWVKRGTPPPIAPRLQATTAPGVFPAEFALDEHGIALGGIRTPYVDVPIAALAGVGNGPAPGAPPFSVFCSAFGVTVPFTDEELAELYPTHGSFVWRYVFASLEAVHSRFLLWPDARALLRAAARSDIGR